MRTRKKDRRKVEIPGQCCTVQGRLIDVALHDLTEEGCRFANVEPRLAIGARVNLMIGGTGPHIAHVRWTVDGDVGVSFARPFTKQQVDDLASGDYDALPRAIAEAAEPSDMTLESLAKTLPLRSVC